MNSLNDWFANNSGKVQELAEKSSYKDKTRVTDKLKKYFNETGENANPKSIEDFSNKLSDTQKKEFL